LSNDSMRTASPPSGKSSARTLFRNTTMTQTERTTSLYWLRTLSRAY
jgi:hypothetical protein